MRQIPRWCTALLILALLPLAARAHDPGLSSLHLAANPDSVGVLLQFAPTDAAMLVPLDTDGDARVSRAEFEAARPLLDALPAQWLAIRRGDDAVPLRAMSVHFEEKDNNIAFRAIIPAPPAGAWTLLFPKLIGLPPGHRQIVAAIALDGSTAAQQFVQADQPWLAITWPAASSPVAKPQDESRRSPQGEGGKATGQTVFVPFLKLGVEHILIGYDHLLFLAGLLLACRRFGSMIAIITSFTVAHSLTLALATFNLVSLSSGVVEPLIAASILYVGVENILRRKETQERARWQLTFVFGLVHGLGFAGVLRELGIGAGGSGALWPLIGFNLGVEAGQLAIACVLLPTLLWARKSKPFERRVIPALSAIVAAAGLFWLIERLV